MQVTKSQLPNKGLNE